MPNERFMERVDKTCNKLGITRDEFADLVLKRYYRKQKLDNLLIKIFDSMVFFLKKLIPSNIQKKIHYILFYKYGGV